MRVSSLQTLDFELHAGNYRASFSVCPILNARTEQVTFKMIDHLPTHFYALKLVSFVLTVHAFRSPSLDL